MEYEPHIRFRGMEPSPSVEEVIRERIERLQRFCDRIIACNVVVDAPHRHTRQGKIYHVHADVLVPGKKIVVGREPEKNHAHEDVYVAIRDCFNALQRQLEDTVRMSNPYRIKPMPIKLQGIIIRLDRVEGFGFISVGDGREFFFRRESLTSEGKWQSLDIGTKVHFTEHEGEKGPYASGVTPL